MCSWGQRSVLSVRFQLLERQYKNPLDLGLVNCPSLLPLNQGWLPNSIPNSCHTSAHFTVHLNKRNPVECRVAETDQARSLIFFPSSVRTHTFLMNFHKAISCHSCIHLWVLVPTFNLTAIKLCFWADCVQGVKQSWLSLMLVFLNVLIHTVY